MKLMRRAEPRSTRYEPITKLIANFIISAHMKEKAQSSMNHKYIPVSSPTPDPVAPGPNDTQEFRPAHAGTVRPTLDMQRPPPKPSTSPSPLHLCNALRR